MSDLLNPRTAPDTLPPGADPDDTHPRDQVLRRSHLVGTDPTLTRAGGGNFSAKGLIGDRPVLWMSSWGCDGAATTEDDFPALYLDRLLELRHLPPLDDRTMLDRIAAAAVTGDQLPPGIETLTHAFIPAAHVDHCHPDAVIALTCVPDGRERAAAEFGDEAVWFDYRQFDMGVAQELADRIAARPRCRFVLLANHGIFTWADTSEQCHRNSLEAVARANRALAAARHDRRADLGGPAVTPATPEQADELLAELLPTLRGTLRDDGQGLVLHTDTGPDAVRFVSSRRGPQLSQAGPGCPDSLVTVGYRPLALTPDELTPDGARAAVERFRHRYAETFDRYADAEARRHGPRRDLPRVVLLPGVGVVASGADAVQAAICAEHFGQTRSVIEAADPAGGYATLTEQQGIADEYWPMMRLKPLLRTVPGRLADAVVLVAGGAGPTTARIVADLAAAGAHVLVARSGADEPTPVPDDLPEPPGGSPATGGPPVVADELPAIAHESPVDGTGGRVVALDAPASEPRRVVTEAVRRLGGFDVVVDRTRDAELLAAATPVFARQRRRGLVCLVGEAPTDVFPVGEAPTDVFPVGTPTDPYDDAHTDVLVEDDPTLVAERIIATRQPLPADPAAKETAS
ncbi:class II aldolase/adducin family protein [Micromonospora sp. WMMD882]|uniref:class II aldolase/adducin family protein n=1 Tax=Micromonospora sp. WMMD882 TaxID=3015151 RepID=UPI00248CA5E9|nr:class II aldolase/adducin family protein [Micromonospora sp. WMMD882]WBB78674.1 class II aldolase/adducin family protein [Micromonospora sp. WMMD882]